MQKKHNFLAFEGVWLGFGRNRNKTLSRLPFTIANSHESMCIISAGILIQWNFSSSVSVWVLGLAWLGLLMERENPLSFIHNSPCATIRSQKP